MAKLGELAGSRQCEICGKPFTPKQEWHRTCFDCSQKAKGTAGRTDSPPAQDRQHADFEKYLERLKTQGYFDEKGNLHAELRVELASMVARRLADGGVNSSQLRKFFTMCRSLEQQLKAQSDFGAIVPEIASLQPHAAVVVGRAQNENDRRKMEILKKFIDVNAELAQKSEKAFLKGFLPHFESVVAYFTLYKPKDDRR